MKEPSKTFVDETTTGQSGPDYRGTGRVTIAARVADQDDFEWVGQLVTDFLRPTLEPKSSIVLPVMNQNPAARDFVLERIASTTEQLRFPGNFYNRRVRKSIFSRPTS